MSLFSGGGVVHWYPCFGLLVKSPLGFKARVVALFVLGGRVHVPDSSLVQHLLTSWQLAWLPSWSLLHTCEGIDGTWSGDLWLHDQTVNQSWAYAEMKGFNAEWIGLCKQKIKSQSWQSVQSSCKTSSSLSLYSAMVRWKSKTVQLIHTVLCGLSPERQKRRKPIIARGKSIYSGKRIKTGAEMLAVRHQSQKQAQRYLTSSCIVMTMQWWCYSCQLGHHWNLLLNAVCSLTLPQYCAFLFDHTVSVGGGGGCRWYETAYSWLEIDEPKVVERRRCYLWKSTNILGIELW